MKLSREDVETMVYLRKRGFTMMQIAKLFDCHFTAVEYWTTPGRREYCSEYSKGRYYKDRIGKMSPREIASKLK